MADIPNNPTKIQIEAASYRAAVSESLMQTIGGSVNYLLSNIMPVGSVIPSMLDEATFQLKTSSDWVLCDGRSVVGSEYEALTGSSNIPDARGVFIRGKNNGRSTGTGNSAGDLALGTYEADDNKAHNHGGTSGPDSPAHIHTYEMYNNFGSGGGAKGSDGTGGSQGQGTTNAPTYNHYHSIASEGSEGRPRNVTMNYFVRIN